MEQKWIVKCYNERDARFGFDCGPFTIKKCCEKALAKSFARHMNKVMPNFVTYFAEPMSPET